MSTPTVVVFGVGTVGKVLCDAILERGWNLGWVANSTGLFTSPGSKQQIDDTANFENHLGGVNLAFIVIPTRDDGTISYRNISKLLYS